VEEALKTFKDVGAKYSVKQEEKNKNSSPHRHCKAHGSGLLYNVVVVCRHSSQFRPPQIHPTSVTILFNVRQLLFDIQ
jgi:hypothetical protein